MDFIGDTFSSIEVNKAYYTYHKVYAPWGYSMTCEADINFVQVIEGKCILTNKKYAQGLKLMPGDIFITFTKEQFKISDHPLSKTKTTTQLEKIRVDNTATYGGEGEASTVLTGIFNINSMKYNPILMMLPDYIHLTSEQINSKAFKAIIDLLSSETENDLPGTQTIINRVCEIFFVQVIRSYSIVKKNEKLGWLAGIADKKLAKVINNIHQNVSYHWTVESMASKAGMSRSSFAVKFKNVVVQTPLEYLTYWRIHKASIMLRKSDSSITEVANKIGYESESAFSRAFKQVYGKTPGQFRKTN